MDAVVVPEVPRQRGSAPTSRPGLQPCQLHADFGLTQGGRTLVADDTEREAGQDRSQGRSPWPVRHLPIGRGSGAKEPVPENPEPDR